MPIYRSTCHLRPRIQNMFEERLRQGGIRGIILFRGIFDSKVPRWHHTWFVASEAASRRASTNVWSFIFVVSSAARQHCPNHMPSLFQWLDYCIQMCFCTQAQSFNLLSSIMHQLSSSPISWHVNGRDRRCARCFGRWPSRKTQRVCPKFVGGIWVFWLGSLQNIKSYHFKNPGTSAVSCYLFFLGPILQYNPVVQQKMPLCCVCGYQEAIGFPVSTCCNWPVWQALTRRFVTLLRHDRQAVSAHHVHD